MRFSPVRSTLHVYNFPCYPSMQKHSGVIFGLLEILHSHSSTEIKTNTALPTIFSHFKKLWSNLLEMGLWEIFQCCEEWRRRTNDVSFVIKMNLCKVQAKLLVNLKLWISNCESQIELSSWNCAVQMLENRKLCMTNAWKLENVLYKLMKLCNTNGV